MGKKGRERQVCPSSVSLEGKVQKRLYSSTGLQSNNLSTHLMHGSGHPCRNTWTTKRCNAQLACTTLRASLAFEVKHTYLRFLKSSFPRACAGDVSHRTRELGVARRRGSNPVNKWNQSRSMLWPSGWYHLANGTFKGLFHLHCISYGCSAAEAMASRPLLWGL